MELPQGSSAMNPTGSRMDPAEGAGVCVERGQTVFQAEVLAILYCRLELLSGSLQEDIINI